MHGLEGNRGDTAGGGGAGNGAACSCSLAHGIAAWIRALELTCTYLYLRWAAALALTMRCLRELKSGCDAERRCNVMTESGASGDVGGFSRDLGRSWVWRGASLSVLAKGASGSIPFQEEDRRRPDGVIATSRLVAGALGHQELP